MVRNQGRVTRFVVMAVLQAARAEALGLPHESAVSWGLNRAIFYAAAKSGFKQGASTSSEGSGQRAEAPRPETFHLGQDEAYVVPDRKPVTFTIGGQAQTPETFDHQVVARFGTKENFRAAWSEALRIVGHFDREVLESPQKFYAEVYKPRRDELSDTWTEKYSPPKKTAKAA
jgi:hypothetical protein